MEWLRTVLPRQYRTWVRTACLMALVGYGLVAVQGTLSGAESFLRQGWVVVMAALALGVESAGRPRLAASVLLIAVLTEVQIAPLTGEFGARSGATAVLPVLVFGCGLLLGARAAILAAAFQTLLYPVMAWLSSHFGGPGLPPKDVGFLIAVLSACWGAAGLLIVYQRTFGRLVHHAARNERRAVELVQSSPDGMVGLDDAGCTRTVNRAAERLLGRSRKEVVGQPMTALQLEFEDGLALAFDDLPSCAGRETRLHVAGRDLELEAVFQSISWDDGKDGWLLVLRDITERVKAEQQAKLLREQLEHAQKMEAVGRLAGGVAHDFNNLLTAMGGYSEILAESRDREVRELAEEQLLAVQRGSTLTQQLLAFARKDVDRRRGIHLQDVLEDMRPLLARLVGESVTLTMDVRGPAPMVADPGQMEQVIMNLASNARDAMPKGGQLTIKLRDGADEIRLEVTDTGTGMDEETRQRVFDPFFTTKPRGKGTGLGLSTVHGIVEASGGRITIDSEVGRGTTFSLTWPRSEQAVNLPVSTDSLRVRESSTPASILLVEDDAHTLSAVSKQLTRAGYTVSACSSPLQALEMVESMDPPPDLLLTDVAMPGMTGPELADRIRCDHPHLPVLFMSGYLHEVLEDIPFDPVEDLLPKPFTRQVLLDRIERKLELTGATLVA